MTRQGNEEFETDLENAAEEETQTENKDHGNKVCFVYFSFYHICNIILLIMMMMIADGGDEDDDDEEDEDD